MGKVVINTKPGGFGLSQYVLDMLDVEAEIFIARHDPYLVYLVEKLGQAAADDPEFCHLKIVEFEGDKYRIHEEYGIEQVITPETMEWIYASNVSKHS